MYSKTGFYLLGGGVLGLLVFFEGANRLAAAEPPPTAGIDLPFGITGDGLSDLPALLDPIAEDELALPLARPSPVVNSANTASVDSIASASTPADRPREEYLIRYSVDNALTRNALQNVRSTGERFFDGFDSVPRPTISPILPQAHTSNYTLRVGPMKLRPEYGPAVSYNYAFGSRERFVANGGSGQVSGGVGLELGEPETGRFLMLNYGASFSFGSQQDGRTNPGQTLTLLGQCDFTKLKLGLGVTFDSLSGANREFGRDIQRQLATISATASYNWTPKTSFELNLSCPISRYSGGIDSDGLTGSAFVNYAYSTKTTFGLGYTTGSTNVDGSSSQTFEQVNLRMASTANPFISYSGTVGFEWRDTGATRSTSPVFGLGVAWTPRTGTTVSVSLDEQVQTSAAIADANFTSTSVTLSGTQRLGSFASITASAGFEWANYESTLSDQRVNRMDRTIFAQAGVSRTFFRHLSLSAMVSYFHTASNDLPQQSTQVTVSAAYSF